MLRKRHFHLDEEPHRQLRVIVRKKTIFIRVFIHRLKSSFNKNRKFEALVKAVKAITQTEKKFLGRSEIVQLGKVNIRLD